MCLRRGPDQVDDVLGRVCATLFASPHHLFPPLRLVWVSITLIVSLQCARCIDFGPGLISPASFPANSFDNKFVAVVAIYQRRSNRLACDATLKSFSRAGKLMLLSFRRNWLVSLPEPCRRSRHRDVRAGEGEEMSEIGLSIDAKSPLHFSLQDLIRVWFKLMLELVTRRGKNASGGASKSLASTQPEAAIDHLSTRLLSLQNINSTKITEGRSVGTYALKIAGLINLAPRHRYICTPIDSLRIPSPACSRTPNSLPVLECYLQHSPSRWMNRLRDQTASPDSQM
jgi:hypothetical protein